MISNSPYSIWGANFVPWAPPDCYNQYIMFWNELPFKDYGESSIEKLCPLFWIPWLMVTLYCVQSLANDGPQNTDEQVKRIRAALDSGPQSEYRIFALRVGVTSKARRNVFIRDTSLPRRIEVAFSFWVLKGNDRVILIDTGPTNRYMIELWKISGYKDPVEALSEIDLLPEQVTDVIVTHSHWDHIGGLSRFKKARIWITKKELKSIRAGNSDRLPRTFRRAKKDNRLHVTRDIDSIAPSIVVVPVGLHTPGCQYVALNTESGFWVFASDVAPLWANFENKKASGQNPKKRTLAVQNTMLELVNGNLRRIIPGHEPRVYNEKDTVEINDDFAAPEKPLSTEFQTPKVPLLDGGVVE